MPTGGSFILASPVAARSLQAALIPAVRQEIAQPWVYVGLAVGGLVFVLVLLAFVYILVRRRWDGLSRLAQLPVIGRADRLLKDHVPRLWAFIRRRFSLHEWHGLALTMAAALLFAAIYLFALITESWADEEVLYALDQRVYGWLAGLSNEPVTSFMEVVTHFGDGLTITLLSLILGGILLLRRYRWQVLSLAMAVGAGAALNRGLKWLFERARPEESFIQAAGHSFPSGHAFLATAFYGFVIYLTWRLVPRDAVRLGVTILLTLLIVLVALSRVMLRVHWVSDVAGGITIGLGWLVVSLVLTRALRAYRTPTPTHHASQNSRSVGRKATP